jgi:hypothetical protein
MSSPTSASPLHCFSPKSRALVVRGIQEHQSILAVRATAAYPACNGCPPRSLSMAPCFPMLVMPHDSCADAPAYHGLIPATLSSLLTATFEFKNAGASVITHRAKKKTSPSALIASTYPQLTLHCPPPRHAREPAIKEHLGCPSHSHLSRHRCLVATHHPHTRIRGEKEEQRRREERATKTRRSYRSQGQCHPSVTPQQTCSLACILS